MTDDAYLDYIRPRGLPLLKATLRVIVAVQCFGAAAMSLSMGADSTISEFLASDLNWPAEKCQQVDDYAAYGLISCGVLTLLRPCWPVLLPVAGWFLGASIVPLVGNSSPTAILEPIEHAARYCAPLALLLLDFWPPKLKSYLGRTVACMWLLRLAAAATFAGHGIVALMHGMDGGHFVELLTVTSDKVFGWEMSADETRWTLVAIGAIDIGLALNVLVSRSKPIVVYMAIWGFATAASRLVVMGPQAYPEFLIRAANGGIPLVLLLYWCLSLQQPRAEVVKAN